MLQHWHLLPSWYPPRGKPSAPQCTLSAGQGLTSHSPRAGLKWGIGPISPTDSEMQKGDSPQLHHPPGSLPIHPPRDRADVGMIPHLTVLLQLQLAAFCPGDCRPPKLACLHCRVWYGAGSEVRSKSRGEFCDGQWYIRQEPLGKTPTLSIERASGHVLFPDSVQESPMATSSSQRCCPGRGNPTLLSSQHQCCHTSAIHLQASQTLLCRGVPT